MYYDWTSIIKTHDLEVGCVLVEGMSNMRIGFIG